MVSSNVSADHNIQGLTNTLTMLTDAITQATTTPGPGQLIPIQETDQ